VAYCVDQMRWHLERLAQEHGVLATCHKTVDEIFEFLLDGQDGAIFQRGLHESVQQCLKLTNRLANEIAESYYF